MIRSTRGHRPRTRPRSGAFVLLVVCAVLAVCMGFRAAAASAASGGDPQTIQAAEARHHVGEDARVCGQVASAAHFASIKGRPTFLNLERPYPDQPFTVVIWGSNRSRFEGPPERLFDGKAICVTGRIETYRGKPQIVVEDPDQITVTTPAGRAGELSDLERVFVKGLLASLGHEANYGTGEWDEATVEAAIAFQEAAGLVTTGDPDPATLRALAAAVTSIPADDLSMITRLFLFEIARRQE